MISAGCVKEDLLCYMHIERCSPGTPGLSKKVQITTLNYWVSKLRKQVNNFTLGHLLASYLFERDFALHIPNANYLE